MKQIKSIKLTTGKGISLSGLAVLIFALSTIMPISANAKSPSYVLECRGGGAIFARIYNVGSVKIYGFRRARLAASVRPPSPGECAWLDRPMSRNEPPHLSYTPRKLPFGFVDVYPKKTSFKWRRYPITTVLKAIRNNKLFFVHVRKKRIDKRWTLNIERVGP